MPIDCSCDVITHTEYRASAQKLSNQVRVAPSFGAAVGIIFRDTHPESQTSPAEILEKRRCQSCLPHIGVAIVEESLRGKDEFEKWSNRFCEKLNGCKECPNVTACAAGFDFSPLR